MPARIRLQIKGHPANRFFWIVASSSKLNPRGRPIERMGYWFPDRKGVYDDRSIVLNRPRLKYWIGLGSEITDGAYRVLSHAGFLPKKPPPFGSDTLYGKPHWLPCPEPPKPIEPNYGAAHDLREQVEETERLVQSKRQTYLENAAMQFHTQADKAPEEELRDIIEKYQLYTEKLKQIVPNTPQDRLHAFATLSNIASGDNFNKNLTIEEMMIRLDIERDEAVEIYKAYEGVGLPFNEADADDFRVNLTRSIRPKKMQAGEKFYVPNPNPVTPFPDFKGLDEYTGDFHSIVTPLKPVEPYDEWFDLEKKHRDMMKKQLNPLEFFAGKKKKK